MGKRLRVGSVPYLNAKPLITPIEDRRDEVELIMAEPLQLARKLRANEVDVALVSSIEFFLKEDYSIVPHICIASHGCVESDKLFYRGELPALRHVALDDCSLTSSALCKILFSFFYGLNPQWSTFSKKSGLNGIEADAFLVIGDMAMRTKPDGYKALDLGEEWHRFTSLPFVYALWVSKKETLSEEMIQLLLDAKEMGTSQIPHIAKQGAASLGLEEAFCLYYLQECVHYDLDAKAMAGLKAFYSMAKKLNLVTKSQRII